FMYLVNLCHENGIGVILDWEPGCFPRDDHGLSYFDGTYLYEHQDPRQGLSADGQMCIYNFGRPEVSNYLIANALFWINEYHVDGIRVNEVAKMLYLDYGKSEDEYVANIYGGNENLEALEFLKHLNSINAKTKTGAMIIAAGHGYFPKLTEDLSKGGVGFSYEWNNGFAKDITEFMYYDPVYRAPHYDEMMLSTVYAYTEKYILPLSHEEAIDAGGSVLNRLPGSAEKKRANYKLLAGYLFAHPGKKLIYMDHKLKDSDEYLVNYIKDVIKLYKESPMLYELDDTDEGFEWINNISANENIISFLRKSKSGEMYLVVCNFADLPYEKYEMGVPFSGKYKEIFNSDAIKYGGEGFVNGRVKTSRAVEKDFRDNSIKINLAALSISIFNCIKA
ncbi:MAG: alpha amylase C-terminal domain-containing protein, partial [Lachnospiraceae bacterium]|nr:alpha amylase C-terminal domain-containing protein [Lachnospiraceae bacterium]